MTKKYIINPKVIRDEGVQIRFINSIPWYKKLWGWLYNLFN